MVFPFIVNILSQNNDSGEYPLNIIISVPLKKLKKHVACNKIKRRTREACRLNCDALIEHLNSVNKKYMLGLIFIHDKMIDYSAINNAVQKIFSRIIK